MFKKIGCIVFIISGICHLPAQASLIGPYAHVGPIGFQKKEAKKGLDGCFLAGLGLQATRLHAITAEGAFGSPKSALGQSALFGYKYLSPLKYNFNFYFPHVGAAFQLATQSWIPFLSAGCSWYPNPKVIVDVSGRVFFFINSDMFAGKSPLKGTRLTTFTLTIGRYFF